MSIVFMAVGVYAVLTFATYFVDIDGWLWRLLAFVLGFGGAILAEGLSAWYFGFGIGGLAVLTLRLEDLLMTKADEAKNNVIRGRR